MFPVKFVRVAIVSAALVWCGTSQAAYTVYLYESSGNVFASGSGTINTSGLTHSSTTVPQNPRMVPTGPLLVVGAPGSLDTYRTAVRPSALGPGGLAVATSGSGPTVGADTSGAIGVPEGYVSGVPMSSQASWNGATLASLGVNTGTYSWTWGTGANADSFTLIVGSAPPVTAAVPTLSEFSLLGLSAMLGALGIARARRKRKCN